MREAKKKALERKGWEVGTVDQFLGLSAEESAYVEMKLRLSENLRKRRRGRKLSQEKFAKLIRSSQSRVAKMEAGDRSVSLDLLVRSLLALGATELDVSRVISSPRKSSSRPRSRRPAAA